MLIPDPRRFPRYSAAFNIWFVFVPSYVTTAGHNSLAVSLACAMVGLVSTAIAAPFFGRLSDRIGRRIAVWAMAALVAVLRSSETAPALAGLSPR